MLSSISACSDDLLVLVIDSSGDGVVDFLTSTRELEKVVDSIIVRSGLVDFLDDGTNSRLPTFELSAEPFNFSSNSQRPLLLFVIILFSVFSSGELFCACCCLLLLFFRLPLILVRLSSPLSISLAVGSLIVT